MVLMPLAGGCAGVARRQPATFRGEVGVTTGSFTRHLSASAAPGELRLLDLPQVVHEQLGMRVIDLMTATLPSTEPRYLDQLRAAAARHGCVFTNLKMNNPGLDLASEDEATRRPALDPRLAEMDRAVRHRGHELHRDLPHGSVAALVDGANLQDASWRGDFLRHLRHGVATPRGAARAVGRVLVALSPEDFFCASETWRITATSDPSTFNS
jgi:hypothetical protein